MTPNSARFDAAHRVPSASAHVGLSILHIDGPEYAVARSDRLRISFNIGPAFATRISGPGSDGVLFCRRNGLLITPPGLALRHRSTYALSAERAPKPARLVVFVVSTQLLAACCIERGLRYSDLALVHQALLPNSAVLSLAQALLADLSEGSPDGAAETEFLAKSLVARVARQQRAQSPTVHKADPLQAVREHIDSNLATALPVSELAGIAGMSQFHFCRVFRDATGKSPHQYILAGRIQAACRMLWSTGRPDPGARSILDIALACGFGSSSHFSTQFKRHMGRSPLQWRASQG
ncbi:AraC-like DNA-binding protein [Variovorax boronicumulans]|uniref:AraC family transcriptional regulator n=1 Tax=Variovorax TaxID=34072 RepID=UPI002783FF42|nr:MULTISPECIES: AraC family transcriptional regulator [Variovorax]MDQ0074532.1 AraC-like DNA-binding protein [Variovorax boronicumulans]MDQ0612279.1 AraC-like DNA-binding protein [Variovorax sp. W1I1]